MHDTVHAFTDNEHDRLPANIRQIKTTLHTRGLNTDLGYSQRFLRPHTGSAGETEPSYTLTLHTPLQHYMHPSHAPRLKQCAKLGSFLNARAFVFTFCLIKTKNSRQVVLNSGSWYCGMVGLSVDIFKVSILMVRPSETVAHQNIAIWYHWPKMETQIQYHQPVIKALLYLTTIKPSIQNEVLLNRLPKIFTEAIIAMLVDNISAEGG